MDINNYINHILFFDIETVSEFATFEENSPEKQLLWKLKCRSLLRKSIEEISDEEAAAAYEDKAGIFAEFGKVVCISVGLVNNHKLRIKSYSDHDEKKLITDFFELLNTRYNEPYSEVYGKPGPGKSFLCGHNIKEFDAPYLCRRALVHQIRHPEILQLAGKKPWETKFLLDTLEMWKFGDVKNYTGLKVLTALFGIPSPKDDIDGSEVGGVYWKEDDLARITTYCEKDVVATTQIFLKLTYNELIEDENISIVK